MLIETIILVLGILAFIVVSNFLMNGLLKILKLNTLGENNFLSIFYNSLLFSLILVTIVSVISTSGKTIFVFNLPLLFLFFLKKEKGVLYNIQQSNQSTRINVIAPIIIFTVFAVIISFYFSIKFSMRNDVAYYTKISECLIPQGIENLFHYYNYENNLFKGVSPYHYFEMWFSAIIFKINHLLGIKLFSNYLLYIYFISNLFRTLVLIGIFGLISKYSKITIFSFLIVLPILVIDISAYCNWGNDSFVAESNFFERPNFMFYYLFLIPIFHSLLNKNIVIFSIWSLIFVLTTITALPTITISLLFFMAIIWFKDKGQRKLIIKLTVTFFLFLFVIVLFYKLFGVSRSALPIESMTIVELLLKSLSIWKACVFMFVILLIKMIPFLILIFCLISNKFSKNFKFENTFKSLVFYVFLLCITGIGVFQLVPYLDNMYQFAFVSYCSVLLLLMIVLAIKINYLSGLLKYVMLVSILIITLFGFNRNLLFDHIIYTDVNLENNLKSNFLSQHGLSRVYINELESNSGNLEFKNGASIIDSEDAVFEFIGLRHSSTYQLGNYFMVFNNNINLPLLSNPEKLYPDSDTLSKDYYKAKNFNSKTLFFREYNYNISYFENLNTYILKKNIQYIFASKSFNAHTSLDSTLILKVIKDSLKGHQLIILKNAKN